MPKKWIYCHYCGGKLEQVQIDDRIRDRCTQCGAVLYINPLPVVSALLLNSRREILLVKRKNEPYKNEWCLPMGFAEIDENLEQAALRELVEETHVKGQILRLIDIKTLDNYFYGNMAIISYEVAQIGGEIKPGDDALLTQFFHVDNLPPLPFKPNETAIEKFKALYKDLWDFQNSFIQFSPVIRQNFLEKRNINNPESLTIDMLVDIFKKEMDTIIVMWIGDINKHHPHSQLMNIGRETVEDQGRFILNQMFQWMENEESTQNLDSDFQKMGEWYHNQSISIDEIISFLTLLRKAIWKDIVGVALPLSVLEIYKSLNINNKVVSFFDRALFHIAKGFEKKT